MRQKKVRRSKPGRQYRIHQELVDHIKYIQAQYVLKGMKKPTVKQITQLMARKQDKEELYHECYAKI